MTWAAAWQRLRTSIERNGPWFGVALPGAEYIVTGVIGLAQPHYDPLTQYVSELTPPDVRYSLLLRIWLVAFPVLLLPFVLALYWRLGRKGWAWVTPAVVFMFSISLAGEGVFHCDAGCRGQTFSGASHLIISEIMAVWIAAGPPSLELAVHVNRRWREVAWINRTWLVLEAVTGGLLFSAKFGMVPWEGLWERVFYGQFYLWIIFLAIHMVGMNRADARQARRESG